MTKVNGTGSPHSKLAAKKVLPNLYQDMLYRWFGGIFF